MYAGASAITGKVISTIAVFHIRCLIDCGAFMVLYCPPLYLSVCTYIIHETGVDGRRCCVSLGESTLCGYCLEASMTVSGYWLVLSCFTFWSQCQALGQALVLFRQGRGGFCRLVWLVVSPDPALWIPAYAGMTVRDAAVKAVTWPLPLWIADQVRNDGIGLVGERVYGVVSSIWCEDSCGDEAFYFCRHAVVVRSWDYLVCD